MKNLLAAALKIIPKQTVVYRKYLSRTTNSIGNMVNTYAEPVTVTASVQPAGADLLHKLGIANAGDFFVVHVHTNAISVAETSSSDIIEINGQKYNIFKTDDWSQYPGQDWNRILIQRAKNYAD